MEKNIKLSRNLKKIHETDPCLISYNIEMTEVTGGTFWKCYTEKQISGEEKLPELKLDINGSFLNLTELMEEYPPINLYDEKIRKMVKELGTAWVRVSGTWATTTYYDFEGTTNGKPPVGYRSVLTKEEWIGVLDFIKETGNKLLISVANCAGNQNPDGTCNFDQAKMLLDFSKKYGVPVNAVEFVNEPNALEVSGTPKGYTLNDYTRDQDRFYRFIRENYPEILVVGPCGSGDAFSSKHSEGVKHSPKLDFASTEELLSLCKESPDVFSYHYYNGLSERAAAMGGHWDASEAHTDDYLREAERNCKIYLPLRDKIAPGSQMWVTESGDAGAGGNTWASTYLDVIRYANELGAFSRLTPGIVFHNTFCSSDYGLLAPVTYETRPNYWFAWIWNKLMGTTVYDTGKQEYDSLHIYAHSRKDGKNGLVYFIVNNSLTDSVNVELPCETLRYTLSAKNLRDKEMLLNGEVIKMNEDKMPELYPIKESDKTIKIAPCTVNFLVVE